MTEKNFFQSKNNLMLVAIIYLNKGAEFVVFDIMREYLQVIYRLTTRFFQSALNFSYSSFAKFYMT